MRLVFGRKTTDATKGGSVAPQSGAVRVDSSSCKLALSNEFIHRFKQPLSFLVSPASYLRALRVLRG
jgi:hypothetical protein